MSEASAAAVLAGRPDVRGYCRGIYLRERHFMTQQQLAEVLGWRPAVVEKIEAGERVLKVAELLYVLQCLEEAPDRTINEILADPRVVNFIARVPVLAERTKSAARRRGTDRSGLRRRETRRSSAPGAGTAES